MSPTLTTAAFYLTTNDFFPFHFFAPPLSLLRFQFPSWTCQPLLLMILETVCDSLPAKNANFRDEVVVLHFKLVSLSFFSPLNWGRVCIAVGFFKSVFKQR